VTLINKKITVIFDGVEVLADTSMTLSEIVGGERPCGGHGRCGKCKIIADGELSPITDTERNALTEHEISDGVRLACLTYPMGDCKAFSIKTTEEAVLTAGDMPNIPIKAAFSDYGVAIDIGTTTLAARLYGNEGSLLAEDSALNPQSRWGADVVSRIEAAMGKEASALTKAIREALNSIVSELAEKAEIATEKIDALSVTGNTVMLTLLTGESVEPFSHAPFDVKELFGKTVRAEDIELSKLNRGTPVYLSPCISAFVGADITCAVLSSGVTDADTAALIDIGTNGEMALWHRGKLKVTSTAAGPAFEGVGIMHGCRAAVGAIDKVTLDGCELKAHVLGNTVPHGICGSGLIDAIACMLDGEIIDESGYLDEEYTLIPPVSIVPSDLRMVQLAKSAICAGFLTLAEDCCVPVSDIRCLYIAGGFGNYLNVRNAVRIGLLPSALEEKIKNVGNAALAGAAMLLLNTDMRDAAKRLCKAAESVSLAANRVFSEKYMSGMFFEEV